MKTIALYAWDSVTLSRAELEELPSAVWVSEGLTEKSADAPASGRRCRRVGAVDATERDHAVYFGKLRMS
jgi:hypothetical protein